MIIRGVVLSPSSGAVNPPVVDLHIQNGRIQAIFPTTTTVTARDARIVLPGLVDLHTHLREPGGDHAETISTGTRAAAAGGFTDVFAMANTIPVTDTIERVLESRKRAHGASARVHVIAAATHGLGGETVVNVPGLARIGVRIFSDDGKCVSRDDVAADILTQMASQGTVFAQHAQHPEIVGDGVVNERVAARAGVPGWPVQGEEAIVARDIALAKHTGGHLHICHVSTEGTVALVRAAKAEGLPVTAEVTPHHLVLTDENALAVGPALKVNPPLRSEADVLTLRAAVLDGTIDAIGTDHAPHPAHTKALPWTEAAFGLTALETALPIVANVATHEGVTDWELVAQVMSVTPANIGGIGDIAGRPIAVGEPATLCVIERGGPWAVSGQDHFSRSANTPFEGWPLAYRAVLTLIEGRATHRLI